MNEDKPEHHEDDVDFDLERRIEHQLRAEREASPSIDTPEVELDPPAAVSPFDADEEPLEARLLDESEPVELDRDDVSPEPAPYVNATPQLVERMETPIPAVRSAADAQRRRDGDTFMMLGGFLGVLAVPVLIGTFFAEKQHAMIVNVAAGAVLLAIGAGLLLWGRFVRHS